MQLELPNWDEMTDGQHQLARETEHGEHSTMAFLTLAGLALIFVAATLDHFGFSLSSEKFGWAEASWWVWPAAIVALIGHMKQETKAARALKYRHWLASYEAEMRRTGDYDRAKSAGAL